MLSGGPFEPQEEVPASTATAHRALAAPRFKSGLFMLILVDAVRGSQNAFKLRRALPNS